MGRFKGRRFDYNTEWRKKRMAEEIAKEIAQTLPERIEFSALERKLSPAVLASFNAAQAAQQEFNAAYEGLAELAIARLGLPLTVQEFLKRYSRFEKSGVAVDQAAPKMP